MTVSQNDGDVRRRALWRRLLDLAMFAFCTFIVLSAVVMVVAPSRWTQLVTGLMLLAFFAPPLPRIARTLWRDWTAV